MKFYRSEDDDELGIMTTFLTHTWDEFNTVKSLRWRSNYTYGAVRIANTPIFSQNTIWKTYPYEVVVELLWGDTY